MAALVIILDWKPHRAGKCLERRTVAFRDRLAPFRHAVAGMDSSLGT